MNLIGTLLDQAKTVQGLPSDMALAAKLGKSRSLVSDWRKGARLIQDDDIARIAELARQDAGEWLLAVHADAKGPAGRAWKALLRRIGPGLMPIMSNAWGCLRRGYRWRNGATLTT